MLTNLVHPANSHHVGRIIANIINCDFVEIDWAFSWYFDFSKDQQIGEDQLKLGRSAILNPGL